MASDTAFKAFALILTMGTMTLSAAKGVPLFIPARAECQSLCLTGHFNARVFFVKTKDSQIVIECSARAVGVP